MWDYDPTTIAWVSRGNHDLLGFGER